MSSCLLVGLVLLDFDVLVSIETLYFHIHAVSSEIAIDIEHRRFGLGSHLVRCLPVHTCLDGSNAAWFPMRYRFPLFSAADFTVRIQLSIWRSVLWLRLGKRGLVDERWRRVVILIFCIVIVKEFVVLPVCLFLSCALKYFIN